MGLIENSKTILGSFYGRKFNHRIFFQYLQYLAISILSYNYFKSEPKRFSNIQLNECMTRNSAMWTFVIKSDISLKKFHSK